MEANACADVLVCCVVCICECVHACVCVVCQFIGKVCTNTTQMQCYQAGIRVMVITGDNKKTAEAICQKIGVITAKDIATSSFTG